MSWMWVSEYMFLLWCLVLHCSLAYQANQLLSQKVTLQQARFLTLSSQHTKISNNQLHLLLLRFFLLLLLICWATSLYDPYFKSKALWVSAVHGIVCTLYELLCLLCMHADFRICVSLVWSIHCSSARQQSKVLFTLGSLLLSQKMQQWWWWWWRRRRWWRFSRGMA